MKLRLVPLCLLLSLLLLPLAACATTKTPEKGGVTELEGVVPSEPTATDVPSDVTEPTEQPADTTGEPEGGTSETEPQEQETQFTEYARLKTWYSGGGFSSETAWVHFKTVDASGDTVLEVLGSDEMNMREEQDALKKTAKRAQLVAKLRAMMADDGWTELGLVSGGEWYEYRFGR